MPAWHTWTMPVHAQSVGDQLAGAKTDQEVVEVLNLICDSQHITPGAPNPNPAESEDAEQQPQCRRLESISPTTAQCQLAAEACSRS